MASLISLSRATQNSTLAALNDSGGNGPAYLQSLLNAASTAIQRHCHCDFLSATYTEYRHGGIYVKEPINLRQFPVTNVAEIATANRAMQVLNNASPKATVQTMSNGDFKLISVTNAVPTTTTLAAATYTTIGAMATAINAVSGWTTQVFSGAAGSYSAFPTTDLKTLQGAASATVGGAYIDIYEPWYGWNNAAWFPDDGFDVGAATAFWRLDAESGQLFGHFPRGQLNLRITYTAGYAQNAIPDDVQEATVQYAQFLYQQSLSNGAYSSVRLGDASVTIARKMPEHIAVLLSRYVAHDRVIAY